MADKLFVIDSTFLLETSPNTFHGAPLLHDSSGRDTTMLFGFARELLRLRKQLGMRKAFIVIGDTRSCVPGPLLSDTIDFLKRLCVPVLYEKGVRVGDVCAARQTRSDHVLSCLLIIGNTRFAAACIGGYIVRTARKRALPSATRW